MAAKPEDTKTTLTVWIDTAFNGGLAIPRRQIERLGLVQASTTQATLADGQMVDLETFTCYLEWFGATYRTQVVANDGKFPLLGTTLLMNRKLTVDYVAKSGWSNSMRQSPLLIFESSAFPVEPGEDEETNPGVYGKALASWLAEQLRAAGVPARDVIAEDFGWCIRVALAPHRLYVACAGEKPDHWQLFAFAEGGIIARLLGKDKSAESLAALYAAVRRCLESAPIIRGLREEAV